jgi:hypothetical protein
MLLSDETQTVPLRGIAMPCTASTYYGYDIEIKAGGDVRVFRKLRDNFI